MTEQDEMNTVKSVKKASRIIFRIAGYIIVYVVAVAAVQYLFTDLLPKYYAEIQSYLSYVQILLAAVFGYLIVGSIANFFYWTLRAKYDHATAAAVRNVIKIIGVGALASIIAGSTAGGGAGTALGGFIGMVIGFATQTVLRQAVAGIFLVLMRPFKPGDRITVAGQTGIVRDIGIMHTVLITEDGATEIMIPSANIVTTVIKKTISQSDEE